MFKRKKGYQKGLNLIAAYPIKFSQTMVLVRYDGQADNFVFSFPDRKVEHIVINLCPTEPWALPNWAVIKENAAAFLHQLDAVRTEYFPNSHCHMVVDNQETVLIKVINQYNDNADNVRQNHPSPPLHKEGLRGNSSKGKYLHLHTMRPVYPYDTPVLMAKNILGLNLAFGQDTMELGILLLEPQTIARIFEHYIQKKGVDFRLIPISGTGLNQNRILMVIPGTPVKNVIEKYVRTDIKYRVFLDGPLNGVEIEDLRQKVSWSTKSIVVLEEKDYKIPFSYARMGEMIFTTSLMGELRRCVYCNYCDDICPVGLEPALYWHCYSRGEKRKTRAYALEKCIECGLCGFTCPSKLELLQVIRECKLASLQNKTT